MSKETLRAKYRQQIATLLEEQRRARHPVADMRAHLHAAFPGAGAVSAFAWRTEMLEALAISKHIDEEAIVWRFVYWWHTVAAFKTRMPDIDRVVAHAGATTSRGAVAGSVWVAELVGGRYGLLVNKADDRWSGPWSWEVGDRESMLASVPDKHFAQCVAMAAPRMAVQQLRFA
jgi:hypothetical protein